MKSYELTKDAEQDLREVARYTRKKWGNEMLKEYRSGLKNRFNKVGKSEIKPGSSPITSQNF